MSEFVTLKKTDAQFLDYLWGTFSKKSKAMAVQSLNLGTDEEIITFEIVSNDQISRPHFFKILITLIKFRNIFLVAVPFFYVLIKCYVDNRFFDPKSFLLSGLATALLTMAFNIKNDVNDHMSGFDRVNVSLLKRPISSGWITAKQASRISWVFLALACIVAIPVMQKQIEALKVVVICAGLILLGRLLTVNTYKNQRRGEILFFILIGPGVVSGFQSAMGAGIDTEVLFFGVLWAWAIQFLVHLNNFQHLMTCSQAGIKNTMTYYGFDKSKKILISWWLIFICLWIGYHYYYSSVFWAWFSGVILIFWSIPTLIHISEVVSSVGSDLIEVKRVGYKNFLLMAGLFMIEFYWYLGNQKGWFN